MYQTDPPRSPKEFLPTMYDLPSEDQEESGLPDEFHLLQPQLLRETFFPPNFPENQVFIATDLNLYYDVHHPLWYKRPDWFAAVGVSRLYEQQELRLSYVIWQEGVSPFVVVELLSPGTEKEDLGQTLRDVSQPPTKWEVYEQVLRVPYYIIFDRYTDQLKVFQLQGSNYTELEIHQGRVWINHIQLGLGLWTGVYQGIERQWLRWCDDLGNWVLTPAEQAQRERQRAERERQQAQIERQQAQIERQRAESEKQQAQIERQRAERLAAQLRALGVEPDFGDDEEE